MQSSTAANGLNCPKFERDLWARSENEMHSMKSGSDNNGYSVNGDKPVVTDSPSLQRLMYVSSCLIGLPVDVHVRNGSVLSGIFHTVDPQGSGIVLNMAQMIQDGSSIGQKATPEASKKPKTIIIHTNELVQLIAKDVPLTVDEFSVHSNGLQRDLMIDSVISRSRIFEEERELQRWIPEADDPECADLEDILNDRGDWHWDQFETNETLFGVQSTFDEEFYTTKLERGPHMRNLELKASRIAREIEGEKTHDLHLAEERGIQYHEGCDFDEESRYSAVLRHINDGRLEENVLAVSDACNAEILGRQHVNDGRLQENEESVLDANAEISGASSSAGTSKSCSIISRKESTSSTAVLDDFQASTSSAAYVEAYLSDGEDEINSIDKDGPLSLPVTDNSGQSLDTSVCHESVDQCPGTSSSSTFEHVTGGSSPLKPHFSPSSSMQSSSSENLTLNPIAKDFKLNPNAKSFIPSSAVRPFMPIFEGSFYRPGNMPEIVPMQNPNMGFRTGPTFGAHQFMFSSRPAQVQSPPPYFRSRGPMYGENMFFGQPQQFYNMPTYAPEMQYRGRHF